MRISDWSSDVCSSDLHPDAADEHALLVERQSARIGGETERRAFGTDQRRGARRAETCRQVAARQLAELHPEQRAAFETGGRGRGREMLLHDLTRGTGRDRTGAV